MNDYTPSIATICKEIKRDDISLKNRLQSIILDLYFIEECSKTFRLPLVANERCGTWYVPDEQNVDSCYFKSTDGHTGEWKFSSRRLNLHLLGTLSEYGSIAIVDSTRKGKLMPDALSKTIPIWCAVLSNVLFQGVSDEEILLELHLTKESADAQQVLKLKNEMHYLSVPYSVISESEAAAISERIPLFVDGMLKMGVLSKEKLVALLGGSRKIILPQWFHPGCRTRYNPVRYAYNILCVTASRRQIKSDVTVGEEQEMRSIMDTWSYVQGAGDDHELWVAKDLCNGNFTPSFWWKYVFRTDGKINSELIDPRTNFIYSSISNEALASRINEKYEKVCKVLDGEHELGIDFCTLRLNSKDTNLIIGALTRSISHRDIIEAFPDLRKIVLLSNKHKILDIPSLNEHQVGQYPLESSKKGSKALRHLFPEIISEIGMEDLKKGKVIILCDTGRDLSVGVLLALLCRYFDLHWNLLDQPPKIDKALVIKHLSRIPNIWQANPSRNTLQSVNSFLM